MELLDYNLVFVHIRVHDSILADTIIRLKVLDIYKEPIGNQRTDTHNIIEECIAEVVSNKLQTLNTKRLHAKQR